MKSLNYRDLTIIPISKNNHLVIACDSSAGLGEKKYDQVAISPGIVARFCIRVPLMELFCVGATPLAVFDTIGNEYLPTGKKMIAGVKKELLAADLGDISLNGSTEENISTVMTSMGITVIGRKDQMTMPKISAGDYLLQLGKPYVGEEVITHLEDIFDYQLIKQLYQRTEVVDMIPVGSKGIAFEAGLLAKDNRLSVVFNDETQELKKSAGPVTVILLAVNSESSEDLKNDFPQLKIIGRFVKKGDSI